jgi:hypothetical protein
MTNRVIRRFPAGHAKRKRPATRCQGALATCFFAFDSFDRAGFFVARRPVVIVALVAAASSARGSRVSSAACAGSRIALWICRTLRTPSISIASFSTAASRMRPWGRSTTSLQAMRSAFVALMQEQDHTAEAQSRTDAAKDAYAEFVERLTDSSDDCIKILDLDARLVSMSRNGQKSLRIYNMDALVGCDTRKLLHRSKFAQVRLNLKFLMF